MNRIYSDERQAARTSGHFVQWLNARLAISLNGFIANVHDKTGLRTAPWTRYPFIDKRIRSLV
jgi:hypothetical protein